MSMKEDESSSVTLSSAEYNLQKLLRYFSGIDQKTNPNTCVIIRDFLLANAVNDNTFTVRKTLQA